MSGTFITLAGKATTPTDPARGVWYGAGLCGFFTDDWSRLVRVGPGIPCCPTCGSPGMQTTAERWDAGVTRFDALHPGYAAFVARHKNHCFAAEGGCGAAWEKSVTLTSWLN